MHSAAPGLFLPCHTKCIIFFIYFYQLRRSAQFRRSSVTGNTFPLFLLSMVDTYHCLGEGWKIVEYRVLEDPFNLCQIIKETIACHHRFPMMRNFTRKRRILSIFTRMQRISQFSYKFRELSYMFLRGFSVFFFKIRH